ncbi:MULTISPECIES: ABC transporter ATP-binding protein [Vibrio]|uniref:ABC transporter ATP-binding protein n=1 Tax=Vibrio casei TaxID=673372 RepID=A0A368LKY4_9VIBR|nr:MULTISPECIES: ABC transporter ATP-binding protein [Vibrio]RCS72532.1 ABC transporter ATP-binding protein [Vibrio casei]SJN36137.1 Ferric iron ABC transporter, ATP-binding protein [Vibrio casei]HBV75121.1 ABC transporter ATP-binding protein [Vibrio sp.]
MTLPTHSISSDPSPDKTALKIEHLTCRYATGHGSTKGQLVPVLENLSLSVQQGEIVCLLGASGCGKTTLLKAIAGLLPLSSGEMVLNQKVIDDGENWLPPEQRNIGLIFQDYALFPHLSVSDNISFGLQDKNKAQQKTIVESMLELVHLIGLEDRYPHQLSGGQQQRVAIARSLACQPDLLLLDEPFSNIDTQVRHELIRDIRNIFKQQGVTAIFVTHSREEAFAFSDKMAVMNKGVIEQFGSAAQLYYQPSSKFVANFLGGGCYLPAEKLSDGQFDTVLGTLLITSKNQIEIGKACEILLRPQQVLLLHDEESEIRVIEQQFMGDHCRYVIDVHGVHLLAQSNHLLEVGQKVNVEVDCEEALVF